jgi:hypothetical protein
LQQKIDSVQGKIETIKKTFSTLQKFYFEQRADQRKRDNEMADLTAKYGKALQLIEKLVAALYRSERRE